MANRRISDEGSWARMVQQLTKEALGHNAVIAPASPCPGCGANLSEARETPELGRPAVCGECGELLVANADLSFRSMTEADRDRVTREEPELYATLSEASSFVKFLAEE